MKKITIMAFLLVATICAKAQSLSFSNYVGDVVYTQLIYTDYSGSYTSTVFTIPYRASNYSVSFSSLSWVSGSPSSGGTFTDWITYDGDPSSCAANYVDVPAPSPFNPAPTGIISPVSGCEPSLGYSNLSLNWNQGVGVQCNINGY